MTGGIVPQVADYPGQRGTDDVLVQRGQGKRQHESRENGADLTGGDWLGYFYCLW